MTSSTASRRELCSSHTAPDENGDVEIGYGTDEPYRGRGLCPEALLALCDWALQSGARRVTAQTEPDNSVSQHVLLKCGFIPAGEGEEGPLFEYKNPKTLL